METEEEERFKGYLIAVWRPERQIKWITNSYTPGKKHSLTQKKDDHDNSNDNDDDDDDDDDDDNTDN